MAKKGKGSHSQSWLECIDTDRLEELIDSGHEYTYSNLCKQINIPKLGGTSKIKQLNELSCICEYEKVNSKFKIVSLRNENDIVVYKSNSKYTPYIEMILSEAFDNGSFATSGKIINNILFITAKQLINDSGMSNENLMYIISGDNQIGKKYVIATTNKWKCDELHAFANTTYLDILKPILRTAMKSLDNRKSIVIQKGYKLANYDNEHKVVYKYEVATSVVGQQIEHIISDAYTRLDIKSTKDLFLKPKVIRDEYAKLCNQLCQERLGYEYFMECYAIVMNPNRIKHNLDLLKKQLNANVVARIYDMKSSKGYLKVSAAHFDELVDACVKIDTNYNFKKDIKEYYNK